MDEESLNKFAIGMVCGFFLGLAGVVIGFTYMKQEQKESFFRGYRLGLVLFFVLAAVVGLIASVICVMRAPVGMWLYFWQGLFALSFLFLNSKLDLFDLGIDHWVMKEAKRLYIFYKNFL